MRTTRVLNEKTATRLVPRKPASEAEKSRILQEVAELTSVTCSGVEELTKRWKKWNVHYTVPLAGVREIQSEALRCLCKSGLQFELGLAELSAEQARILADSEAPDAPHPALVLSSLQKLSSKIAAVLVSEPEEDDTLRDFPGFGINGAAEMDGRTLEVLLSSNDRRVQILGLSEKNARLLAKMPPDCSLAAIHIDDSLGDGAALALSQSAPWRDLQSVHCRSIAGSPGYISLMRRLGASKYSLNLHCDTFHEKALHALLDSGSIVQEIKWKARQLDRETAVALLNARRKPAVSLEIDDISADVANVLARYPGKLSVSCRGRLATDAAEILVHGKIMNVQSSSKESRSVVMRTANTAGAKKPKSGRISIACSVSPTVKAKEQQFKRLVSLNSDVVGMRAGSWKAGLSAENERDLKRLVALPLFDWRKDFCEETGGQGACVAWLPKALGSIYKRELALTLMDSSRDGYVELTGCSEAWINSVIKTAQKHDGSIHCIEDMDMVWDGELEAVAQAVTGPDVQILRVSPDFPDAPSMELMLGVSPNGACLLADCLDGADKEHSFVDLMHNFCTFLNISNNEKVTMILCREHEMAVTYAVFPSLAAVETFLASVRPLLRK